MTSLWALALSAFLRAAQFVRAHMRGTVLVESQWPVCHRDLVVSVWARWLAGSLSLFSVAGCRSAYYVRPIKVFKICSMGRGLSPGSVSSQCTVSTPVSELAFVGLASCGFCGFFGEADDIAPGEPCNSVVEITVLGKQPPRGFVIHTSLLGGQWSQTSTFLE